MFVLGGYGAFFSFPDKTNLLFKTFDVYQEQSLLSIKYLAKAVNACTPSSQKVYNVLAADNMNLTLGPKELLG